MALTPEQKAEKRAQFLAIKARNDNGQLLPAKRKKIPEKVRRQVLAAQEGLCARCEEPISGRFDVDHILERDLMGSDDLGNLVALHPDCHRPKTSARAGVLAKVHRLARATFEGKPESKRPLKSGGKLQSRPFPAASRRLQSRPMRAAR